MHKTGTYTVRLWGTTNFRNIQKHTSNKIILVLFPIEDLRQVVETAKRILTKEKINRQLAGQSSTTPFMNIKDNCNSIRVTFNMQDGLENKI